MNEKDRFEAFMRQAEFFAGRHDKRREYEWKVTLAFWTAIIAIIGVLQEQAKALPKEELLNFGIAAFILYIYWLYNIWCANDRDKTKAFEFRSEAGKVLQSNDGNEEAENNITSKFDKILKFLKSLKSLIDRSMLFQFLADWSMKFQFLTTALLLLLIFRLLTNA